jgi:hypothetical protein
LYGWLQTAFLDNIRIRAKTESNWGVVILGLFMFEIARDSILSADD